jgi:VWFA-related protein
MPQYSAMNAAGAATQASGPAGGSQQEAEKAQQPIRVGVSLVNLYATVRDNKKRIVPDLKQEEFRVFEEGKEQKVAFFSRETNLSLTFGMLIDTSPSQQRVLGAEQEAGARFLRRVLRDRDLGFVFSFDVNVDMLSDLSGDVDHLIRAMNRAHIFAPRAPIGVQGPFPQAPSGTQMYDAIYLACREKLAEEVGRKALVLLTDAVDVGSKVSLEEALETAQRSDTVLHFIVISDYAFYRDAGYSGVSGEGVAKKLAEQTGGRSIVVNNEKDLEKAFDQISEELRTQYTLGFYPENTTRDGKFRRIRIDTTRKDTKVLARRGYYAPGS